MTHIQGRRPTPICPQPLTHIGKLEPLKRKKKKGPLPSCWASLGQPRRGDRSRCVACVVFVVPKRHRSWSMQTVNPPFPLCPCPTIAIPFVRASLRRQDRRQKVKREEAPV